MNFKSKNVDNYIYSSEFLTIYRLVSVTHQAEVPYYLYYYISWFSYIWYYWLLYSKIK